MIHHNTSALNYYVLNILGLLFEIFGALFVSMEAIGINRFLKVYKVIYKISIWGKKSVLRMILVTVPFFIPFAIAIPTQSTIIIALMLPALTLLMGLVLIIDHPDYYEDLIRKKTEQHKIGPLGFVIMLIGFIFQLTSVVWQMCVNL